jgi:ATP-binding cassette, subfamily B, multidrug efflux pump
MLGCVCLAGTNALGMTIPWLLKLAVDALRSLGPGDAQVLPVSAIVARNAALIAAAAIAQALVRTASRILIFNAGRNIEFGLRRDLFAHLCRMDPGFYRRHATGDIMSRMTNDLSAVRMLFGPGILNVVNTVMVYVTGIWLLARLNPRLTLIALVPYPALIFVARLWSRKIYAASRGLQDQLGVLSTTLQEDLAGIAVVKNYALEDRRHAGFARQSQVYLQRALGLARSRGSLTPLFAVIGAMGTLIVLWAGGREVIAGRMTLGALVAFNAYLAYLSFPTIALGWILAVWQRGVAAWVRVRDVLSTESAILDLADPATQQQSRDLSAPSLRIVDLSVIRDDRRILDAVSFSVPVGSTMAIVGPTGSGKTTLVDAIPRLLEVPRGTVFVGDRDVHDLPLGQLRSMIGYAPQEAFLFSDTVGQNVAFGIPPGVSPSERARRIERAVEAAGLTPDLAILPDRIETVVGERGITLSGGQRQRVALARAIAAEPQILILDDSLSSVDAQTEREILTRLAPILRGRTSIIVSHRVAAVRAAHQILVLDRGTVAERGTHDQLLAAGGLYASLYREQLAAEALGVDG